jgi:DNA-directed RNA polymerase subunit RPC12/RpoP/DNA-binding CsgD family transcriptional regulator
MEDERPSAQPEARDSDASPSALSEATLRALIEEGLTQREIAARVERSIGTVRHWLTRYGLKTIRHHRPRDERRKRLYRTCVHHGWTEFVDDGTRYRCVRCRSEAVIARRRKVKRILVEEAGGRCQRCGYDRYIGALHFHHRKPASKHFGVSYGGFARGIEALRIEARKCVLLCSNCHAEVEIGLSSLE